VTVDRRDGADEHVAVKDLGLVTNLVPRHSHDKSRSRVARLAILNR
jgi:hypothetical protein